MKLVQKFGFVVLLALMVSCSSTKPSVNDVTTNTITIKETVRDTVFKIEKDSSLYKAYLDCVNGKVVVKEVTQIEPGRNLKSPKVRIDNNKLTVDCESQMQELRAQLKEKSKVQVIYRKVIRTEYINKLTWWQQTQIYGFRLLAVLLIVRLCWLYFKPNKF